MGNCLGSCFGQAKKKTNYFVGRYKDYNVSIEFENLIDDDSNPSGETAVLTESERQHLLNKRFTDIENDQRRKDAEIDAELHRQEENLRIEEDSYNSAKREAARIAKQAQVQQQDKKKQNKVTANGSAKSSWLGDDEDWDVAGGEDDFEMFLDSVKARSQAVRANVDSLVCATNRPATNTIPGHKDSVTSTNTTDLEWEYEEGFSDRPVGSSLPYRKGESVLAKSKSGKIPTMSPPVAASSQHQQQQHQQHQQQQQQQQGVTNGQDSDLEWDSDFVSADTEESGPTMRGGMPFGGTDSESVTKTSEKNNNAGVKQDAELKPAQEAQSGNKTEEVPTPGHSGIAPNLPVQSVGSVSSSSSKISPTPKQIVQTTPTSPVLSNSSATKELPRNISRTESPAESEHDGISESEDPGSTEVVADSIDDLENFDIDKFLEELDFDT